MTNKVELAASHLMTLSLTVDAKASQMIGNIGGGTRMIAPIAGGSFSGVWLNGKVLPGGANWVLCAMSVL